MIVVALDHYIDMQFQAGKREQVACRVRMCQQ